VKNSINSIFDYFYADNNPNLTCITVDNVGYSTVTWDVDPQMSFSTNCGGPCSVGINELTTNPIKELSKIIDLTGREILFSKNTVMIYVYEDGSSEKIIEIE
jgi:hypothetical protein